MSLCGHGVKIVDKQGTIPQDTAADLFDDEKSGMNSCWAFCSNTLSKAAPKSYRRSGVRENENDVLQSWNLVAVNGLDCPADIVFIATFKHLRDVALEYLRKVEEDEDININTANIEWIITIPVIWSHKAVKKMREWIKAAQLIQDDNQCRIEYEPDCAALAIYHKLIKDDTNNFHDGDTYILVDAGGGTVDITCYKIYLSKCEVEEIASPTGGILGGCYIDDKYIELLENIFSKEWMNEFKTESPNIFVNIIDNFKIAKSTFDESNPDSHQVQLPYEFVQFLQEKGDTLQQAIDKANENCLKFSIHRNSTNSLPKQIQNIVIIRKYLWRHIRQEEDEKKNIDDEEKCNISLMDEELFIDCKIWKCIFGSTINKITNCIKELLITKVKECKYLYLVGGMACSQYYVNKTNDNFGIKSKYNLKVIVPDNPSLIVAEGAAYLGINKPNCRRTRRLNQSFGIRSKDCWTYFDNKKIDLDRFHCMFKQNTTITDGQIEKRTIDRASLEDDENYEISIISVQKADIDNDTKENKIGMITILTHHKTYYDDNDHESNYSFVLKDGVWL